jgi:hypothetical protein
MTFTVECGRITSRVVGKTHEEAANSIVKAAMNNDSQHTLGPFITIRGSGFETGESRRYTSRSVVRSLRRFGEIS